MDELEELLEHVRACSVCKDLPLGPRPVVQVGSSARVVIIGQAPGSVVHECGVPWADASGDHLREWLDVDDDTFYDPEQIALIPMGFCYPGKSGAGDAPPRPECAPLWHEKLLKSLPEDRVIVLAGMYAQKFYLESSREKTLTETVRNFETYLPEMFPVPHPAWRSKIWMKKNLWFEDDVLPRLREIVSAKLSD